ncbi:tRNA-splicing endonuclease subunit Sen34 [Chelonus insularis]|uniref:tRNA-splicing endonuclease subunit Sen34 n=1 Tax=Chelonus insularis TaxID=460826 RepID=UPI00158C92DC|nr:tRNA-splicing endonuclease subunit Sen34 [Chelonus insularis]
MIDLVFSNGQAFVWNADDWLELRQKYKIIGSLIGCLSKLPRQEIFHGLPMLLMPEEVTLLLEKKIVRLVQINDIQMKPNDKLKQKFNNYRNKLFSQQEERLKEERKKQIIAFMDKIVEGKRRKLLGLKRSKKQLKKNVDLNLIENAEQIEINREVLLTEELEKIPKLEPSEALIQIHTAYPWSGKDDVKEVKWNYPQSPEENIRYTVFKDLWERGFYVTYGDKFGGDFLAYPGDPIMFHSQYVITCKNGDDDLPILDLIGQCRVACSVRKTQVYAYINSSTENLMYQSFYYDNINLT